MKTRSKQLLATAYHEAGHAVAAIEFDERLKHATIVPGKDSLGHIFSKPPKDFHSDYRTDPRTVRLIDHAVLGLLAGFAAQWRHTGRRDWRGARRDFECADEVATYMLPHDDTREKYLRYMILRARDFVHLRANLTRIEAVAEALVEHKHLSGARVREVCFESMEGSLRERRQQRAAAKRPVAAKRRK